MHSDPTVLDLFLEAAALCPGNHAFEHGNFVVTYAELDVWTSALENRLESEPPPP